jgi:ATP-dependent DNA ligase
MRGYSRNYGHYVAYARPPGRLHRAVPSHKTDKLPSGSQWLHEIKHDGFRVIARKDDAPK